MKQERDSTMTITRRLFGIGIALLGASLAMPPALAQDAYPVSFTHAFGETTVTAKPDEGYVLAYVGLLSVVVQAGLIGMLTRRFRENWLILTGLWIMAGALLAWAFTSSLVVLLIVLAPLSLSGGVLNTVIQSAISKSVSREEVGGMLGIASSLEAITRVIAPTVGGLLLQNLGRWAPGVFSAILMAWVVTFTYRRIILPAQRERLAAQN